MAIGDVGDSVLSTLTLDTTGYQPSICRVYGSVYAVAYSDSGLLGKVKTFSIDSSGTISAVLSTLTFDSSKGITPSIIKAHDGIFAVAYQGADDDGFCKTFSITNAGIIGAVIDTLEFDTDTCIGRAQNFLRIYGNIFAYAYQGSSSYLVVKTWSIDTAGDLGSVLSTLTVAVGQNKGICFIHCTGSLYATLINQTVEDTQLDTFTISDAGTISSVIATATIDSAGNGTKTQIVPIGGNNYALTYYKSAAKVVTRSISPAGVIGAEIDNASLAGVARSVVSISGGVYAYACTVSGVASIRTIPITPAGVIGTETDYLDILATPSSGPHLIHHRENLFACALSGPPTNDGLVKTFTIANAAPLPSVDIARVTGIRHIYRPGFFRMILSLGDVSNTIEIAEAKVRRELEIPEQQTPKPEPYPFAEEPRIVPPTPYRTGIIPPGPELEPVAPEPARPITIPTMPGVVLPEDVARKLFPGLEIPTEPPPISKILAATIRAAIPYPVRQAWRAITPWREEAGETFGGEVVERFEAVRRFFGGLFR